MRKIMMVLVGLVILSFSLTSCGFKIVRTDEYKSLTKTRTNVETNVDKTSEKLVGSRKILHAALNDLQEKFGEPTSMDYNVYGIGNRAVSIKTLEFREDINDERIIYIVTVINGKLQSIQTVKTPIPRKQFNFR